MSTEYPEFFDAFAIMSKEWARAYPDVQFTASMKQVDALLQADFEQRHRRMMSGLRISADAQREE